MKTLILAAAIAVSSVLPFATASEAANVTLRTVERVDHRVDHRGDHRERHARPRHHRKDCVVKKVRTHHHGRTVVRTTRVCR